MKLMIIFLFIQPITIGAMEQFTNMEEIKVLVNYTPSLKVFAQNLSKGHRHSGSIEKNDTHVDIAVDLKTGTVACYKKCFPNVRNEKNPFTMKLTEFCSLVDHEKHKDNHEKKNSVTFNI